MSKNCVACGMPMSSAEDFPNEDQAKEYCRYCARADGSMQSYEEKLQSYASWIVNTQGLSDAAALEQAKHILSQLPAWKQLDNRG